MKMGVLRGMYRAIRATYGPHNRPTERTINYTISKFETQFSLLDNTRPNRPHPARSEENIEAVAESVREDRKYTVSVDSSPFSTAWPVLFNNLAYFT